MTLGASGAPEALVGQFAATLLGVMRWHETPTVIALHNTNGGYGANSYLPGEAYAAEAEAVLLRAASSSFLFLTRKSTFDCFRDSDALLSLVLQSPCELFLFVDYYLLLTNC